MAGIRFDTRAKQALKDWPSASTKLWSSSCGNGPWLRAQPVDGAATGPRLFSPGSRLFKTQPDGLWIFLVLPHFADCVAIEACSSSQNFADKRSRYMPSNSSTMVECPGRWLNGRIRDGSKKERWKLIEDLTGPAGNDLVLPIRYLRVLYFLENDLYARWRSHGNPAAHEFVASYSSIKSYTSQKMQDFLRRMSLEQQFYKK